MTDNTADRAKILDRIRKLLAMAADVGSPNEAAIAARRAKALMEEYNIAHGDVMAAAMTDGDFIEHVHGEAFYSFPGWQSVLALGVAKYCDVRVTFIYKYDAKNFRMKALRFQGERSDIAICTYLYDYLVNAIRRLAEQGASGRAARGAFRRGASNVIVDRLAVMKREERAEYQQASHSKALVLVNAKAATITRLYGRQGERKSGYRTAEYAGYTAGARAAAGIQINKALNGARGTKALTRG